MVGRKSTLQEIGQRQVATSEKGGQPKSRAWKKWQEMPDPTIHIMDVTFRRRESRGERRKEKKEEKEKEALVPSVALGGTPSVFPSLSSELCSLFLC